jgi:hypothetical protein
MAALDVPDLQVMADAIDSIQQFGAKGRGVVDLKSLVVILEDTMRRCVALLLLHKEAVGR